MSARHSPVRGLGAQPSGVSTASGVFPRHCSDTFCLSVLAESLFVTLKAQCQVLEECRCDLGGVWGRERSQRTLALLHRGCVASGAGAWPGLHLQRWASCLTSGM